MYINIASETAIKIQGKADPSALYLQFDDTKTSNPAALKLPVKTYISKDVQGNAICNVSVHL